MKKNEANRILLTGFGGQGIVLSGYILGKAASIYDGRESTFIQSYGPEARGGACSAQVVVSTQQILYPYVEEADILVVMSQEAFHKYFPALRPGGTLLYDDSLVTPEENLEGKRVYSLPASRIAEELGRKMVANIVMLGFLTAVTGPVSEDSMKEAVRSSVPKGTDELNLNAFAKGFEHGKAALHQSAAT